MSCWNDKVQAVGVRGNAWNGYLWERCPSSRAKLGSWQHKQNLGLGMDDAHGPVQLDEQALVQVTRVAVQAVLRREAQVQYRAANPQPHAVVQRDCQP